MMHIEKKFVQALHFFRHHREHAPYQPIHEVYQSSAINALLEGVYDGTMTSTTSSEPAVTMVMRDIDGSSVGARKHSPDSS